MSENGPYGQQPGFQPPYGGSGPQYPPQDQQMYAGGQPPYGPGGPVGPGGPGGPGYPPPKKSSAGLWIVIVGGVVIVILVIAVVFMLIRGGGDEGREPQGGGEPTQGTEETTASEEPAEDEETQAAGPQGEPPYELPQDPCASLSESTLADIGGREGSKSLTDSSSDCTYTLEGEGDQSGYVSVTYQVPYGGSDSIEGAKERFQSSLDRATDESNDIIETEVHEVDEKVDVGEEAALVFSTQKILRTNDSVATLLVRQGNIVMTVDYTMTPGYQADESEPAPLKYDDVKDLVPELGEEALGQIGA